MSTSIKHSVVRRSTVAHMLALFTVAGAAGVIVPASASGATVPSASPAASEVAVGPAAAQPMTCSEAFVMGGETSCKSQDTWYEYAKADCAARGYTAIGSISYDYACPGGFEKIQYTCC